MKKRIIAFVQRSFYVTLFFTIFILPVKACATPHPAEKILDTWKRDCQHPLCGRLYDVEKKSLYEAISSSAEIVSDCNALTEELHKIQNASSLGSLLLLGEIHDNAEHHKLRAAFIQPPVVVMEQFTLEQQSVLDTFFKTIATIPVEDRLNAFEKDLKWKQSPWMVYNYAKLFEAVLRSEISIRAGDPSSESIRKTSKYGLSALTTQDLNRLGLNENFEKSVMDELRREIKDSHCGMLPESFFDNMVFAQRYRDATLAESTVQAIKDYGSAIVLAGNAHVRRDRGIPWYLQRRLNSLNISSIVLLEVEKDKVRPEDYELRAPNQNPLSHYIVFTPKAQRDDPCKKFGFGSDLKK